MWSFPWRPKTLRAPSTSKAEQPSWRWTYTLWSAIRHDATGTFANGLFPSQPVTSVDFADLGDIPDSFFETGEELSVTLPATVHVNGVDAVLDFEITARLDSETDLVVLGVVEFTWADFGMTAPVSSIFTVADDVRAELLLYAKAN